MRSTGFPALELFESATTLAISCCHGAWSWKYFWDLSLLSTFSAMEIYLSILCRYLYIYIHKYAYKYVYLLSLQSCPTLCDPIDGSPPCSSVPGLSRQEHWSGLLFPSPMHESEKWKGSHSVLSIYSWPHGLQPTRLLRPWDWPGKSNGVGCHHLHIYIWVFFSLNLDKLLKIGRYLLKGERGVI